MIKFCCIITLLITLLGCEDGIESAVTERLYEITVDEVTFESEEIAKNSIGADSDGLVTVYLPGNYETSGKEYAVVYYLHGFSGSHKEFKRAQAGFENYSINNRDKELIVVSVNGKIQDSDGFSGFYVDSKVTGNWESYFINEVIPKVEAGYRIKKNKNSRGLMGFSMGGSCTFNIALKRPDLFGAIYALSPGVLSDVEQLKVAVEDWKEYGFFRKRYTSAFAEEVLDYPAFDNTDIDNILINKWMIGYGSYKKRVADYVNRSEKLNKIMVGYGKNEYYTWIPQGSQWLYEHMNAMNLPVELYTHTGDHEFNSDIVENSMLPFFRDNLE